MREHNLEPSLELFERVPLVEAYADWLRERAELKATASGSQMRVSSAIIGVYATAVTFIKWLHRNHANKGRKWRNIDTIETFRQLESENWVWRDANEVPLSNDADPNWVDLDTLDEAREKLEKWLEEHPKPPGDKMTGDKQWAATVQDLLLVSLWTRIPPLRSQVPRTLKLLPYSHPSQDNRLSWVENNGCYALWFPRSKTCTRKSRRAVSKLH